MISCIICPLRKDELTKMSVDDIQHENSVLIVTIPES
jgi:hypothetical protein